MSKSTNNRNKRVGLKANKKTGRFESMWTPKLTEQARKLYVDEKKSLQMVANAVGCSLGAVQNLMNKHGWMRKKATPRATSKANLLKDRIIRDYTKKKLMIRRIGSKYNYDPQTVLNLLKQWKVPLRSDNENNKLAGGGQVIGERLYKEAILRYYNMDLKSLTYQQYCNHARNLTAIVRKRYWKKLDTREKEESNYDLDHNYSVHMGYMKWSKRHGLFIPRVKPVRLTLICHPANLQFITKEENQAKGRFSGICIRRLRKAMRRFERKHGKVFDV